MHVILTIFQLWEWAFLLIEVTVCCRFYYWREVKVFQKAIIVWMPVLAPLSNCYWSGMGMTATVQCMTQLGLLLSCDNVLKFDWYCQLSGGRSNSLNSRKLPGCFSYGLGMRLRGEWGRGDLWLGQESRLSSCALLCEWYHSNTVVWVVP